MNVNSAGKMTSEEAGDTDPSAVPDEPPAAGSEGTGAEAGSQDRSTEEGVEKPAEGGDRAEDEAEVDGAAEEGGVQVEDGAASEDRESPASAGGDPDEQERDAEAQEAAEEMGGEEEGRGGETGEGEGKGEGKGGEEREEVEARVEEGQGTGDEGAQGSGASDREDATEEASGIDAGKNDERYSIRDAPWADEGGVAGDWGPEEVPASAGALAKQLILNFYQQRRMEQTVVGILSHNVVHNTGAWSGVRRAVAGRLLYGETLRDL